jgi:hypothetical protein
MVGKRKNLGWQKTYGVALANLLAFLGRRKCSCQLLNISDENTMLE